MRDLRADDICPGCTWKGTQERSQACLPLQATITITFQSCPLNCIFFFLLKIASCKFFLTGPRGVPVAMIWEHQLCSNSLLLCSFSFSACVLHISSINP